MIVKMLTHVHLLAHTWWCWHTLRRRWSLKGREGLGSSLPSAELARRDSALFEKMKSIFSIAPMGNLEKSRECFSLRNTHRTLVAEAPDAMSVRLVCYQCLAQLGLGTRRQAPDVGLTLFVCPVWHDLSGRL